MNDHQTGRFVYEPVEVTTVHSNLAQEVVKITVDRLKLILQSHIRNMETRRDWIAPLGMLVAMLIVFPTTEFKTFGGIKAETWQAAFMIATVIVFGWLVKTVVSTIRSPSLEDVIERIKRGE